MDEQIARIDKSALLSETSAVERSARLVAMSLQRTCMSAERMLLSVVRTAMSLIGFGFITFNLFSVLHDSEVIQAGSRAPRQFGLALMFIGICMLIIGVWRHMRFAASVRRAYALLVEDNLVPNRAEPPNSFNLFLAIGLFFIAFSAFINMMFEIKPMY
jgi:putative membrane protein